jgi:glyoxylase-like metal-dependent hydrolase (beta-lactamase superfamily II)/8-oxo-dGTP pyrophosphatase MutT (NUDIX family)
MSETIPGFPVFELPPAPTRDASAVVLWRPASDGHGREVFWVRRGKDLRFAGGFFAFPGGKVDAQDSEVVVAGASGEPAAFVASAARELFEETGLLVARGARRTSSEARETARKDLLAGRARWRDVLERLGVTLDAADFTPAGRWVTPPYVPIRFDARFFLAAPPEGQEASIWPGELSDGGWIRCEDALEAWRRGRALLHPPSRYTIECLAAAAPPHCIEALRSPPHCSEFVTARIDLQEHLYLVPLRTPTLPPATHTNTYLVGDRQLALVDPGSVDDVELARLFALLDTFAQEDRHVTQIWLTHHHTDHVGGLRAVWSRLGEVPVLAHPLTGERVEVPYAPIDEGTRLLGRWRALHTPGHARGHICFFDEETGALIAGDMVSSVSTIVIDPPEGDMAVYLEQLARLRALSPRTIYPAHGMAVPNAVQKLDEYLEHRAMREKKVLAALATAGTLADVTARAYDDTPTFMHIVAERSCLASLQKLEREGRAARTGEKWQAVRAD